MAKIIIENDVQSLVKKLANIIADSANEAIARDDIFKVGLSGVYDLFSKLDENY